MKRSTERILTTHTGSLARPPELLQMLVAREEGKPVDPGVFDATVRGAVLEKVKRQAEIGLAVVNDGEQSKISFATYVRERLHGFGGADEPRPVGLEARQFPTWAARRATPYRRPACNAPVAWKDFAAVEKDIANLKAATAGLPVGEVFMTAVSPGTLANFFPNRYYPTREAYLEAMSEVMKREYEAIVQAGFILQLDCPDLALRSTWFPDLSIPEFRTVVAQNIEALNAATRDIPAEQVRMHVCWGAGETPHNHDIPLRDIVDVLLTGAAGRPVHRGGQRAPRARVESVAGRAAPRREGAHPRGHRLDDEHRRASRGGGGTHHTLRHRAGAGERHRRGRLRLWHQCADRPGRLRGCLGQAPGAGGGG